MFDSRRPARARGGNSVRNSEQLLYVVANFVGNDVGLGEIAGGAEACFQLAIKAQVEIHFLIFGAIKRPDGSTGKSAGRIDRSGEQVQLRVAIGFAVLAKQIIPDNFGIAENDADEMRELIFLRSASATRHRLADLARLLRHLLQQLQWVSAQQPDDQHQEQGSGSAADNDATWRKGTFVLNVFAFFLSFDAHGGTRCCMGGGRPAARKPITAGILRQTRGDRLLATRVAPA